jgi:hypothetical protein
MVFLPWTEVGYSFCWGNPNPDVQIKRKQCIERAWLCLMLRSVLLILEKTVDRVGDHWFFCKKRLIGQKVRPIRGKGIFFRIAGKKRFIFQSEFPKRYKHVNEKTSCPA